MKSLFSILGLTFLSVILTNCSLSPEKIASRLKPSIVKLSYKNKPGHGHGTGFFVPGELGVCTVLTAAHVVDEEGKVRLRTEKDGKFWDAATVKIFPSTIDMALVTFKPETEKCNYRALKIGNSDSLRIGSSIFIYGFPRRGGALVPQFVDGKVSALDRLAWGYGVSLTPLQILTFYNAIANDGIMVKPQFVKALRTEGKIDKVFDKVVLNEKIASKETILKLRKVLENVVKKGTATNIYTPNFSMAGKTGTAKKYIPLTKDALGNKVGGYYSNKDYVASFAGFFPADKPKYSCIVVIHKPNPKKGYYGATVAAPVFRKIAEKIYVSAPLKRQVENKIPTIPSLEEEDKFYYAMSNQESNTVPNVKGMAGMDAVSVLENLGLKVRYEGVGKVRYQSIKTGQKLIKGAIILLKLS